MGPKFRDRERLPGCCVGVPPLSAIGCRHASHLQYIVTRDVAVVVKMGDPDTSRLNRINDGVSNHRRIALIGRLVSQARLRLVAEGVAEIKRSTQLPLAVLRVNVVVVVEIKLVGVEIKLRSDEPPGSRSEGMIVLRL